jgi:hypothetical protein
MELNSGEMTTQYFDDSLSGASAHQPYGQPWSSLGFSSYSATTNSQSDTLTKYDVLHLGKE